MSQRALVAQQGRAPAGRAGQTGNPETGAGSVELPGQGRARRKEVAMAAVTDVNMNLSV